jgi:hypothetical protein
MRSSKLVYSIDPEDLRGVIEIVGTTEESRVLEVTPPAKRERRGAQSPMAMAQWLLQ